MQGLGNDFVVLDGIAQRVDLAPAELKRLADRRYGVGCDQILVVEKPTRPDVDFRYRIWNADGVEVEQCGNGARCFVHFVRQRGLTDKQRIRVETAGGVSLEEIHPSTMESRACPGVFLTGEILDVDGRIGGFNFQWAWSSARAAARGLE